MHRAEATRSAVRSDRARVRRERLGRSRHRRASRGSPHRAARRSSTCTPTPTTTDRCSRSPGPGPHDAADAARELGRRGRGARLDRGHDGVHPFVGALDVVPFVALGGTTTERGDTRRRATSGSGGRESYGVPVFLYDDADPGTADDLPHSAAARSGRARPTSVPTRRTRRSARPPSGATTARSRSTSCSSTPTSRPARIGARWCASRDGGLPGVRALGLLCSPRRPAAGLDEPRRPRPHRDRGRVPARARRRPRSSTDVAIGRAGRAACRAASSIGARRVPALGRHRRRRSTIEARHRPRGRDSARPARRPTKRAGEPRAPDERALAADAAAFPLGHATPDPELLAVPQRVLEALVLHLAAAAHGLGLLGGGSSLREEQVGIDPEAVGALLPTSVCLASTSSSMSISRIGGPLAPMPGHRPNGLSGAVGSIRRMPPMELQRCHHGAPVPGDARGSLRDCRGKCSSSSECEIRLCRQRAGGCP